MQIPSRAVLAAQLHCLSKNAQVVITAQQWNDPAPVTAGRPRSWLRLVRNGREEQVLQFTGARAQREMARDWDRLAGLYTATSLDEGQMWAALRELTGIEQVQCSTVQKCPGLLPVAWPWCPECGRDQRNVAKGSLSGVRRRPDICLDLRKTSS